jgi:hypothetical protein
MKFKHLIIAFMVMAGFTTSCTFDQVEPERAEIIDPDIPTSFADEIQPIFTAKCTGCHPPVQGLDLTAGNAYNSINNSTYINLSAPDQSRIYTFPISDGHNISSNGRNYSDKEAALVLKWIEEGALDN